MWPSRLTNALILSSLSMLWLSSIATAEPRQWSARSSAETKTFVELYTSEG